QSHPPLPVGHLRQGGARRPAAGLGSARRDGLRAGQPSGAASAQRALRGRWAMTVVCGTDLSAPAAEAAEVAARVAAHTGEPLVLVQAIDRLGSEHALALGEPEYEPIRAELAAEADRLRGFGATVEVELRATEAARTIVAVAEEQSASMIVIAPVGR